MIFENTYTLRMVPETIPPNATLDVLKEHFNKKGIYVRLYTDMNLVLLKYKRKFCDITDFLRNCRKRFSHFVHFSSRFSFFISFKPSTSGSKTFLYFTHKDLISEMF